MALALDGSSASRSSRDERAGPTLEAFFTESRPARARPARPPSQLDLADLDARLVGAFLTHLECERGNNVRTRNARLAAIRSLFRFAALHHPNTPS